MALFIQKMEGGGKNPQERKEKTTINVLAKKENWNLYILSQINGTDRKDRDQ